MIFSNREAAAFFAVLLLAGWALYPSEYTRGLMHREQGNRARAVEFFRDYLRRHPYHKGATLALANAYEEAGRPEEAIGPMLAFYRHRRGDAETGRAILALLARVGQAKRLAEFRWELFEDAKALPAPPRRFLEELMYKAFQEAAAAQDDKATFRALRALAELTGEGGGYQDEMLRLLMQRRQLDAAVRLLRDASRRQPSNVELRRTLSRVFRLMGDDESALAELQAATAIAPGDASLVNDRYAIFKEGKRWKEAEAELRRLIRLEPRELGWSHELAQVLFEDKRPEEALRVFEALVVRKPGERERWWTLIYALSDRGYQDRAIERTEAFLRRFPWDPEGENMLIYLLQSTGRLDRATDLLKARVAAAPRDPARRAALGSMLLEQERLAEAAEQYRVLTELQPSERENWLLLASVYQTLGDAPAAVALLERYRLRFADDAAMIELLASLYLEQGDRPKAIELLKSTFGPSGGSRLRVPAAPAWRAKPAKLERPKPPEVRSSR